MLDEKLNRHMEDLIKRYHLSFLGLSERRSNRPI